MASDRDLLMQISTDVKDVETTLLQLLQQVISASQGTKDVAVQVDVSVMSAIRSLDGLQQSTELVSQGLREMTGALKSAADAFGRFGENGGEAGRKVASLMDAIVLLGAVGEAITGLGVLSSAATNLGKSLATAAGEGLFAALATRQVTGQIAEMGLAASVALVSVSGLTAGLLGLAVLGIITVGVIYLEKHVREQEQRVTTTLAHRARGIIQSQPDITDEQLAKQLRENFFMGGTKGALEGRERAIAAAIAEVRAEVIKATFALTDHERASRAVWQTNKFQLDVLDSLDDELQKHTTEVLQRAQVEKWSAAQTIKALEDVRDKYAANDAERLKMNALIATVREQEANRVKSASAQARAEQQQQFAEGLAQLQAEAVLHGKSIDQQIADLKRYGTARAETAVQWRTILLAIHALELQKVQQLVKEGEKLGGIAREAARGFVKWGHVNLATPQATAEIIVGPVSEADKAWVKWGEHIAGVANAQEAWLKQVREGMVPGLKTLDQAIEDATTSFLEWAMENAKTGDEDRNIGLGPGGTATIEAAEALRIYLEATFQGWADTVMTLLRGLSGAFGTFFSGLLDFSTSLGEDLTNLWSNLTRVILNMLAELIGQLLLFLALSALIPGFGGTFPMSLVGFLKFLGIKLQHGAVVTGPTFALIGEAGPEVVIPLDHPRASGVFGGLGGTDMLREIREQNRLLARIHRTLGQPGVPLRHIRLDREAGLRYGLAFAAAGIR